MRLVKAHAYGNDFLLVSEDAAGDRDRRRLARALCDRHGGIGADGLMLYRPTPSGAAMSLINADGSPSEVSGNGIRCLAALLVEQRRDRAGGETPSAADPVAIVVDTPAGPKRLTLAAVDGRRLTFEAEMGSPTDLRQVELDAVGERIVATVLRVGNPQCVVIEPALSEARLEAIAPALCTHPAFPEGTNVELAVVESPRRVRILIWERGVGPTLASGTGACAAAVAAAAHGGAARDVEVVSPGGSQRVVWNADGIRLTGWAELIAEATWLGE